MFIRSITLNNFRVYNGSQTISFEKDEERNVYIISGKNGYGKTSFLTALLWCMYGKNMQEVDASFKKSILDVGGYPKYLRACMNNIALSANRSVFSVDIVFSDISVPGFACNEILIERTFYVKQDQETLQILIDQKENELVHEVGKELFINDFILPKEIAKFFFFDAEKNVSLAETQSVVDKKNLSKAYSEILGIKKYDELKKNLQDLQLRYRKNSADAIDAEKLNKLESEIKKDEKLKLQIEDRIKELSEQKEELKIKIDRLQEKLIREGSVITLEEIKTLQTRRTILAKEYDALKGEFIELMELAPFAIVGNVMGQVKKQLDNEKKLQSKQLPQDIINEKINDIKKELSQIEAGLKIDKVIRLFYEGAVADLLSKHLVNEQEEHTSFTSLHHFTNEEQSHFESILQNLRSSYRSRLSDISKKIKNNRFEFNKLVKVLSEAEGKENDQLIENYRNEKKITEDNLAGKEDELITAYKTLGSIENQYASKKRVFEELSKKVKLLEKYEEKDMLASRLIQQLDTFLLNFKVEKRISLRERILAGLNSLMHKKNFVTEVEVSIEEDMVDVKLFSDKKEIIKENLSKGEQQLYATALLKALVEESNIRFPVFIDSPMQKYDSLHAAKVIAQFYPSVSKQVVLFPLLYKEMTDQEYQLLLPYTKAVYLINNEGTGSSFVQVEPVSLFKEVKTIQINVRQHQNVFAE